MSVCQCGCGQPTPLAKFTATKRGHRKGEPLPFVAGHYARRRNTPAEVVAKFVRPGASSDCWPWQGATDSKGYGAARVAGRQFKAHRLAYELSKGSITGGQIIRHTCDNPPCCNPAHLVPGTHADNARDKAERDRSLFGERAPSARLTEQDVRLIRARAARGEHSSAIAEAFGVSGSAVRQLLSGRTWRRVEHDDPPKATPARFDERYDPSPEPIDRSIQ